MLETLAQDLVRTSRIEEVIWKVQCTRKLILKLARARVKAVWSFVLYERPILGDHPKAHSEKHCSFHENHHFSVKTITFHENCNAFHEKWQFSLGNLINQLIQDKSFSFIACLGEAMSDDSMKTAAFMKTTAFHENRTKDHQLPGMVTLCFIFVYQKCRA